MPDSDPAALVEFTSKVVSAYLAHNHVTTADMPALIRSVHDALSDLGRPQAAAPEPVKPTPPVPIKKSVTDDYIVCLEDGLRFKSMRRHLATLGLTPADYRAKWGLPSDYPMVAPAFTKARSALAKARGLGARRNG